MNDFKKYLFASRCQIKLISLFINFSFEMFESEIHALFEILLNIHYHVRGHRSFKTLSELDAGDNTVNGVGGGRVEGLRKKSEMKCWREKGREAEERKRI